jgi:hypothetical protein
MVSATEHHEVVVGSGSLSLKRGQTFATTGMRITIKVRFKAWHRRACCDAGWRAARRAARRRRPAMRAICNACCLLRGPPDRAALPLRRAPDLPRALPAAGGEWPCPARRTCVLTRPFYRSGADVQRAV